MTTILRKALSRWLLAAEKLRPKAVATSQTFQTLKNKHRLAFGFAVHHENDAVFAKPVGDAAAVFGGDGLIAALQRLGEAEVGGGVEVRSIAASEVKALGVSSWGQSRGSYLVTVIWTVAVTPSAVEQVMV